jgi:hypothetical protein
VLPGSPFRTIEEYFMQQQAPPEERSAMRNALRTVFGVPLTTLGKQDFADRELHRLYNEGTVGLDVKDDGSSSYFVKQPQTKEGMYATMLMEMHKEMPGSLDRVIRREYRRRQSLLEGMGLK